MDTYEEYIESYIANAPVHTFGGLGFSTVNHVKPVQPRVGSTRKGTTLPPSPPAKSK
jgi:hypothetical protein